MEPHSHDFYFVMLFTKGGGSHTINLVEYPVKPGSVFFMSPSEIHSWSLREDTDGYVLFFNSSFYFLEALPNQLYRLPFFRSDNKVPYGMLNVADSKEAAELIRLMVSEERKTGPFRKNILRSLLDALLYKLAAVLDHKGIQHTPVSHVPALQILIEQHFLEHRPVTFYADSLHLSVQQLNQLTRNYLNRSVLELIRERMLAEAKRLLLYSSLSISEIAYKLNFNDNSYFTRFFRKMEKVTPEQFRQRFI